MELDARPSRLAVWLLLVALACASVTIATPSASAQAAGDHIQAFGRAPHVGSLDTLSASGVAVSDATPVGMASTPTGLGYWLLLADGNVYTFGDAGFFGSMSTLRDAGLHIDAAAVIVALAATPTGLGYWLVDDRGGVYTFGDARFFGAPASEAITEPVVGFAATARGDGYRVLTSDGRVRSYGLAPDHGSASILPGEGALALAAAPTDSGYWVVTPHDRHAVGAPPLPAGSGSGRRIVYSNSRQRVWLVEASGAVSHSWLVSGRRGIPAPGTYRVFSKSPSSAAGPTGGLRLGHMVRFARGQRLAIGFHAIPTARGRPIQGIDELGEFRSAGCVRQDPRDAATLYAWAPIGTAVVVTP